MDGVSAAASILGVAEAGAKLSLTLYKIADSYRTAAKDIQSVAKNTALFAAVLKDLGRVLERGKKLSLYRPEAYENCYALVQECDDVFGSIRRGLKVDENAKENGKGKLNVDRTTRLLWMVNKPKVELWQGRLESLKATVSVQLAVLNYGERAAESSDGAVVGLAEMLALKAVILANDTAKKEYDALVAQEKVEQANDSAMNLAGASIGGMNANILRNDGAPQVGSTGSSNVGVSSTNPSESIGGLMDGTAASMGSNLAGTEYMPQYTVHNNNSKNLEQNNFTETSHNKPAALYRSLWTTPDIVEHAIRKVEGAEWEFQRLQENRWYKDNNSSATQARPPLQMLIQRLSQRLDSFNLPEQDKQDILEHVQGYCSHSNTGIREQLRLDSGKGLETIRPCSRRKRVELAPDGPAWRRWIPDLVDDILWEHTANMLNINSASDINSNLRVYGTAQEHELLPPLPSPPSQRDSIKRRQGAQATPIKFRGTPQPKLACFNCLASHTKCDEGKPMCSFCKETDKDCLYTSIQLAKAVGWKPSFGRMVAGSDPRNFRPLFLLEKQGRPQIHAPEDGAGDPIPSTSLPSSWPNLQGEDHDPGKNRDQEPTRYSPTVPAASATSPPLDVGEEYVKELGRDNVGDRNKVLHKDDLGVDLAINHKHLRNDNDEGRFDAAGNKIVESKKKAKLTSSELRKKKKNRVAKRKRGEEIFSGESEEYNDNHEPIDLRPAKSFADLKSHTPSPVPFSASVPVAPQSNTDRPQEIEFSLDRTPSASIYMEQCHGMPKEGRTQVDWAQDQAEELLRRYTFITPA